MNTSFTSKQREVLARKLGYEGPMQGFDQYLQSSPALMMRYNAVTDKYAKRMAKGGVVGYADGGATQPMSVEDARQLYEDMRGFNQQSYAKIQALPEVQALGSFTQTFAGRQPTPQELAKAKELNDAIQNSPAFKAISQEQQDFGNRNKQRVDALNSFLRQNPNQFEAVTGKQQLLVGGAPSLDRAGTGSQIQAFNQQQANAAQQFNQQATPPTVSPEAASQMAQTGPTTQELTEGRAREQQQAAAGAVTGGGNVTFEETEGRTGVPIPGQAAGITPAATPITSEQSIAGVGGAGTASEAKTTQTGTAAQATEPTKITAKTAEATTAAPGVKAAMEGTKPLSIEEWGKDKAFPTVMEVLPDGRIVNARRAAYEEYVRNFKPEGGVQAAQGTVSEQAQVKAQQGYVSPDAIARIVEGPDAAQVTAPTPLQMTEEQEAKAATVADVGGVTKATAETTGRDFKTDAAQLSGTPQATAATNYTLPEAKSAAMSAPKVMDAAKASEIPSANTDQTTASSTAVGQQRAIAQEELVDVSKQSLQITEPVQAVAATMDKLNRRSEDDCSARQLQPSSGRGSDRHC
jgi:hypothetical protein